MTVLKDISRYVRSKNAGPFWMTIDIFCDTKENYEKIKKSKITSPELIADLYDVKKDYVKLFYVDDLLTIKISVPRPKPQGHMYESDMHSGQQYVKLLNQNVD